jgi:hypothetical protein
MVIRRLWAQVKMRRMLRRAVERMLRRAMAMRRLR